MVLFRWLHSNEWLGLPPGVGYSEPNQRVMRARVRSIRWAHLLKSESDEIEVHLSDLKIHLEWFESRSLAHD